MTPAEREAVERAPCLYCGSGTGCEHLATILHTEAQERPIPVYVRNLEQAQRAMTEVCVKLLM